MEAEALSSYFHTEIMHCMPIKFRLDHMRTRITEGDITGTELKEIKIICFFVDHGYVETLDPEYLRLLDTAINRKLPYQAINVSLHGLEHVAQNPTALSVLRTMALGKSRVADPIISDNSVALVLYDTDGDVDVNVNEEIMQQIWKNMRKTKSRSG